MKGGRSAAFTTLEPVVRHELDPVASARAYDASQLATEFQVVFQADQTEVIIGNPEPGSITLTDAEVADLIAFLHALSDPGLKSLSGTDIPESVPSGLPLAD